MSYCKHNRLAKLVERDFKKSLVPIFSFLLYKMTIIKIEINNHITKIRWVNLPIYFSILLSKVVRKLSLRVYFENRRQISKLILLFNSTIVICSFPTKKYSLSISRTSLRKSSENRRQNAKPSVDDFQNYEPVRLKDKTDKTRTAEDDAWELLNA